MRRRINSGAECSDALKRKKLIWRVIWPRSRSATITIHRHPALLCGQQLSLSAWRWRRSHPGLPRLSTRRSGSCHDAIGTGRPASRRIRRSQSPRRRLPRRRAKVRITRPGDLRPVLPQTVPDLGVTIRREDPLAAPGQGVHHAVALLRRGVVGKSRSHRCRRSQNRHDSKPIGSHVSFPRPIRCSRESMAASPYPRTLADGIDEDYGATTII